LRRSCTESEYDRSGIAAYSVLSKHPVVAHHFHALDHDDMRTKSIIFVLTVTALVALAVTGCRSIDKAINRDWSGHTAMAILTWNR